jgi:protein tyrosine/serine phosphatase
MIMKYLSRSRFALQAVAALSVVIVGASLAFGKEPNPSFPNIRIKNFGQMSERFYRGAQPGKDDYKDLAALGIRTIVDLRDDPESYEQRETEAAGMRYVNIAMSDKEYPRAEQIAAFLKLVDEPATGKFYVHCAGGRHRTGVMGAVYRFNYDHWNYDQVYAEMKSYDFYTRFGHGEMKHYVEDYWQKLQTAPNGSATKAVAARE